MLMLASHCHVQSGSSWILGDTFRECSPCCANFETIDAVTDDKLDSSVSYSSRKFRRCPVSPHSKQQDADSRLSLSSSLGTLSTMSDNSASDSPPLVRFPGRVDRSSRSPFTRLLRLSLSTSHGALLLLWPVSDSLCWIRKDELFLVPVLFFASCPYYLPTLLLHLVIVRKVRNELARKDERCDQCDENLTRANVDPLSRVARPSLHKPHSNSKDIRQVRPTLCTTLLVCCLESSSSLSPRRLCPPLDLASRPSSRHTRPNMSDSASTSTPKSPEAPESNLPPAAAAASHAAVKTAISSNNDDVTVLSDTTNFNVKHPLYSPWTLWFDSASKQDKAKSWEEALSEVISFQSVEEFWGSVPALSFLPLTHSRSARV